MTLDHVLFYSRALCASILCSPPWPGLCGLFKIFQSYCILLVYPFPFRLLQLIVSLPTSCHSLHPPVSCAAVGSIALHTPLAHWYHLFSTPLSSPCNRLWIRLPCPVQCPNYPNLFQLCGWVNHPWSRLSVFSWCFVSHFIPYGKSFLFTYTLKKKKKKPDQLSLHYKICPPFPWCIDLSLPEHFL